MDIRHDTGLSPLARGKPMAPDPDFFTEGPIPAGAGETSPIGLTFRAARAYPRWRGGNTRDIYMSPGGKGPIPAGAGETAEFGGTALPMRAYPRWRGGNRF